MCRLHLAALGAAIGNSTMYFLHTATFAYGSQLVEEEEMIFSDVFR